MQELPAPAPPITPETEPFWDATAEHRLLLPECRHCGIVFWYPRSFCPSCGSTDVTWREASGRGVIYTFTIARRASGLYREAVPYVLAYVELDEGPRVMTNIVDCPVDHVAVGQQVEVVFHDTEGGIALPRFRPIAG